MADSAGRTPRRARSRRRGAGRPSAAESARRAEDLLEVAAQVFFAKGYEKATVAEIARRARASKQTLYSRFPTKADLFTAVMKRRSDAGFARVTTLVESGEPLARVLADYAIELLLPFVHQDLLRLLRTIITASAMFPDVGRAFWTIGPERAHQMLVDLLRDRMAKGELRESDPGEAAHLFLAMCSGRYWYRTLVDIRPRVTQAEVEVYARCVVDSFLRIYTPATTGQLTPHSDQTSR